MNGSVGMAIFAAAIDAHDWDALAALLHDDFSCRYVHTGEVFSKAQWVQLNADYPGFQHFVLEDVVTNGDRAVGRAHVTGSSDGADQHFQVATFVSFSEGLIMEMVEVWTDVDQSVPEGSRPA